MVNDTYNALQRAITELEGALNNLKTSLSMSTDPASLDTGVPVEEQAEAPGDQFSTPALAHGPEAPTITPVDESAVPDDVKAADQGT